MLLLACVLIVDGGYRLADQLFKAYLGVVQFGFDAEQTKGLSRSS